jgi:predicted MFS family arabinose efflux permease
MAFEEATMTTTTLTSIPSQQAGRRTLSARAAFVVAAYTVALTQFASVVPSPLYHSYAELWGFSAMTLTLIYATYAAGILVVLLLAGRVSDEVGRRPVLLVSLATLAAAAVVFYFADGSAWLFAGRLLQGLGIGAALGTASATLLDLHPRHDGASVGIVTAVAASLGIAFGLLTSAVAVQDGPAPLQLPYVLLLALIAIAIAGVWFMPETVETRTRFHLTVAWPHVPSSVRRPFALASLAAIGAWSVGGLYFSLGPRLGAHVFETTNVLVALSGIITLSFAAPLAQLVFGRIPAWQSMFAGAIALAVATLTVVVATTMQSGALYIAGSILGGAAWGLTFLGGLRSLAAVIPAEHRAGVYSAFYVVSYGALSVPAVLAGIAADRFGLLPTFQVFGAVVAAIALVVAAAAWRTRPSATVHHITPVVADERVAA